MGTDPVVCDREVVRAAESIVSPLGWERTDIRQYHSETVDSTLHAFE